MYLHVRKESVYCQINLEFGYRIGRVFVEVSNKLNFLLC